MVESAAIKPHEKVLEIGTGKGVLTRELSRVAKHLEAVEVDPDNYREVLALNLSGLKLGLGDAFSEPRNFDVLVSSLPYSESSTFVEWLAGLKYDRAIVMLQKDFVEKLKAAPGEERYRAISVVSQISSSVESLMSVTRDAFVPPPRVSSELVLIRPRLLLSPGSIRLVKLLFSQKRRKLEGALKRLGLEAPQPASSGYSGRVGTMTPDQVWSVVSETNLQSIRT